MSLLIGLGWLAGASAFADDQPHGNLVELHSCEVYAGGCTVSSEATLGGRYLLQVWDFTGGSWQNAKLGGLQVAVLETSPDNLATAGTRAAHSVVYLPTAANASQRSALLAWLISRDPQLADSTIETRVVPLTFDSSAQGVTFKAGTFADFKVVSLGDCQNRVCGESLWYEPSAPTSLFTVALNAGSEVNEPLLQLKWDDNGKRSVFLARFGPSSEKDLFVSSADWCGPTGALF